MFGFPISTTCYDSLGSTQKHTRINQNLMTVPYYFVLNKNKILFQHSGVGSKKECGNAILAERAKFYFSTPGKIIFFLAIFCDK
ncbi:MAG: hypothetical protein B6245_04165 [Desulfobacteraceae bacterium 4572_88]|nr:MAG: hypothetical protein B6245_04165 [Desulfobacteraceae bacterium 4572_88]